MRLPPLLAVVVASAVAGCNTPCSSDNSVVVEARLVKKTNLRDGHDSSCSPGLLAATICEISQVLQGSLDATRVQVFHLAVVGEQKLETYEQLRIGNTYRLTLEPFGPDHRFWNFMQYDPFEEYELLCFYAADQLPEPIRRWFDQRAPNPTDGSGAAGDSEGREQ